MGAPSKVNQCLHGPHFLLIRLVRYNKSYIRVATSFGGAADQRDDHRKRLAGYVRKTGERTLELKNAREREFGLRDAIPGGAPLQLTRRRPGGSRAPLVI